MNFNYLVFEFYKYLSKVLVCATKIVYLNSLLNKKSKKKNEKLLNNFLVQGPGYTKRPLGHRVA